MKPTLAEQIAEKCTPRTEITKLSVSSAPYETFGVGVYGLDERDHECLVMRTALSVEECGIMVRGLEQIVQRKIREAINEFRRLKAEEIRAVKYEVDSLHWEQGLERAVRILEEDNG